MNETLPVADYGHEQPPARMVAGALAQGVGAMLLGRPYVWADRLWAADGSWYPTGCRFPSTTATNKHPEVP